MEVANEINKVMDELRQAQTSHEL